MRYSPRALALSLALSGLFLATACEPTDPAGVVEPTVLAPADALAAMHDDGHDGELTPMVRKQIAALRRMTAPFHDLGTAMEAGYDVAVTPCLAHPTDGAMGVHYGNLALFDGRVELLGPETVLYEPRKNGGMRLVGLEYIVPFDVLPPTADAPELLGQHFHANHDAGVWALHVWLWRHNPEGLFADWNPNVTCDWAG